jgi:hypothetical protein
VRSAECGVRSAECSGVDSFSVTSNSPVQRDQPRLSWRAMIERVVSPTCSPLGWPSFGLRVGSLRYGQRADYCPWMR